VSQLDGFEDGEINVIQEFANCDLKSFYTTGQIAFMQPSGQVRLCVP
jgi:hypothetical protein